MVAKKSPKMERLVVYAIRRLQDVQGSTSREISNYISKECNVPSREINRPIQLALKRAVSYGILQKTKGGGYRYNLDFLNEPPETGGGLMEPCKGRSRRRGRGRGSRRKRHRSGKRSRRRRRGRRGRRRSRRRSRRGKSRGRRRSSGSGPGFRRRTAGRGREIGVLEAPGAEIREKPSRSASRSVSSASGSGDPVCVKEEDRRMEENGEESAQDAPDAPDATATPFDSYIN